ncbi:MAG: hypothetical protein IJQ15_06605 [Synergistaceae bacterium]|nr:hypothetical protein [Synergistaceae bacterium]MBQ6982084.1 hypothetical protein [Synergistaceae bacterium]
MKKVCISLLVLLVLGSDCYGAVSEDIYVRKDVFEANMQGINTKLDILLEQMKAQREEHNVQMKELREEMKELRTEMKTQREEHNSQIEALRHDIAELTRVVSVLSTRVDAIDKRMDGMEARIGNLKNDFDGRIGELRNGIYLWLVIFGIVLGMPAVQKMFQSITERKPSLTVEDVKRLIDEAMSNHAASSSGN